MSKADLKLLASFKGSYQADIRWIRASNMAMKSIAGSRRQAEYRLAYKAIEAEYAGLTLEQGIALNEKSNSLTG